VALSWCLSYTVSLLCKSAAAVHLRLSVQSVTTLCDRASLLFRLQE